MFYVQFSELAHCFWGVCICKLLYDVAFSVCVWELNHAQTLFYMGTTCIGNRNLLDFFGVHIDKNKRCMYLWKGQLLVHSLNDFSFGAFIYSIFFWCLPSFEVKSIVQSASSVCVCVCVCVRLCGWGYGGCWVCVCDCVCVALCVCVCVTVCMCVALCVCVGLCVCVCVCVDISVFMCVFVCVCVRVFFLFLFLFVCCC